MQGELAALLALQERDKALLAVQEGLRALQPELAALDEALARVETALANARKRVGDADQRRTELEGKIESYRVMQERRRQRLEWVRGAKEASTLMAELDLARSVLAREEAEWLRSADLVQEAERGAAEAERALEELHAEQLPARESIAERQAASEAELETATAEREVAARAVPAPLLERYERILKGRAPLALYPLNNGACGHCFTAIPLHKQQKLNEGGGVENCEGCGVLVFATAE